MSPTRRVTDCAEGPKHDLMMPVMDGWEFIKQQSRDWRFCTIPTIVITGVASHDPRCLEMPVVRFLPKPYTAEQLMAAIEAEVPRARSSGLNRPAPR